MKHWQDFESQLDEHTKWFRATEVKFRDQQLQASLPEKEAQLKAYIEQRKLITAKEKDIDSFVDKSHILLNNSGAERIKPLISQISNRYQLLHVLSKEVINRWQSMVENHRAYQDKLEETSSWLTPLEENLAMLQHGELANNIEAKASRLQVLLSEREQAEHKLSNLTIIGERLFPDTAAVGREKIRKELREIRERWDKLEEGIKEQQKLQDAQSLQWSSYQEMLQQTLVWLDTIEKSLELDPSAWSSAQEIRAKLFKHKTTQQEIVSHKRIIEAVTEKAQGLLQLTNDDNVNQEIQETVKNINKRYKSLVKNVQKAIARLEESLEIYQQFSDLQKAYQDYQKQLWDKLSSYTDYSGNKAALQLRLAKVVELQDSTQEGNVKLQVLVDHVNSKTGKLPGRTKEAMEREVANLKFDFEKFVSALNDVKHNIEGRLQQWTEYEASFDRLLQWLSEAEANLKNYSAKSTLEEKQEQLEKYQVRKNKYLPQIFCPSLCPIMKN